MYVGIPIRNTLLIRAVKIAPRGDTVCDDESFNGACSIEQVIG